MPKTVIPIRSTTQRFTEIIEINHDVVLFADGSAVVIVGAAAVNFGLLSDKEQEAIIYSYAGLLNSLSFPVQVVIRTQHKDITSYLKQLEIQELKQTNPKLKSSIASYREFVESTVKEKNVLDKKFYLVIPFSALEMGVSAKTFISSKKRGLPYPKEQIFERAITVLTPKKDHLLRLLARIGLRSYQLNNEQLIKLFFNIYNPGGVLPHSVEGEPNPVVKG